MRLTITVLGLFGGLVLLDHGYILSRFSQLMTGYAWDPLIAGPCILFVCWVLATGLVLHYPGLAARVFAFGSAVGLATGYLTELRMPVLWGVAAGLFAVATLFARREQRTADQRAREHDRHLKAMTTTLIDVRETVVALTDALAADQRDRLAAPDPAPLPEPTHRAPVVFLGDHVRAR